MNLQMHRPGLTRRMQRAEGTAALTVKADGGVTRIEQLFQEGAAKLRFPQKTSGALEAVLINTAGGQTGGDRFAWSFEAKDKTALSLTTQACEKIYRAGSGHSAVSVSLRLGAHARLAWLPQETILFDQSALVRTIEADMDEGASLLMAEAVIFGRSAMGETVASGHLRDRWRIKSRGRLVHAEDLHISPQPDLALGRSAVAGGGGAMAAVLMIGPEAETRLAPLRRLFTDAGVRAAASHAEIGGTGKLLARIAAPDGLSLRQVLAPALALLNGEAGLPKIWSS